MKNDINMKREIINQINTQYSKFIKYLQDLDEEEFEFRHEEKWSAREQLEHIIMCIKPLVKVYGMQKKVIKENFGSTNLSNKSYQGVMDEYLEKLNTGGKAPQQYVPGNNKKEERNELIEMLTSLIEELNFNVNTCEETELETLLVPHPLLGKITLKEMLYNAIYHVQHHQAQIVECLKNYHLSKT